jgi:UDP:flavonoid glycosyltransferase YjiC (YdhE family)
MSDQIYLAQRITTLGAGVQIDQDSAPATIREAVQTVVSTPSYREAAGALRTRIGQGGARRAAEVLEAMLPVKVAPARR